MEEEKEEEDKKREKEYFCRRGFGLGYRVPVQGPDSTLKLQRFWPPISNSNVELI